ncbi:hypothetical protein AMJ49_05810 [Parcubacteria bacterium DG_74_2]|nr:MAG: hypothetical protein AMJ49_05810 [Parcubacteria bacterium DG_74_2]
MRIIKKIKLDKWKKFFKKLPRNLAEQSFRSFMFFVLFALIFGGCLFYKYSILAERKEPEISKKPIEFREDILKNVLNEWQKREIKFNETETKKYPDLFKDAGSHPAG